MDVIAPQQDRRSSEEGGGTMSFRARSAWVTIVALLVSSVLYVVAVVAAADDGGVSSATEYRPQLVGFVVVLALLSAVGQIAVALVRPREAQAAADERERVIGWRSSAYAGYVLGVLAFVVLCLAVAEVDVFWIANITLALWVAAQLVESASVLVLSR